MTDFLQLYVYIQGFPPDVVPWGKNELGKRKSPLNTCFVYLRIAGPRGGIVL